MIVSSQLFKSYLECPTKCWLHSHAEPATGNVYQEWTHAQNEAYFRDGLKLILPTVPESDRVASPPVPTKLKDVTWRLAVDALWRTKDLESRLQAVERVPAKGGSKRVQLIPYSFEFANKVTREHKLRLAFDSLLLSEAIGREVALGMIIHGDSHAILRVKTLAFASEVRKLIKDITALLAGNSAPNLVLNRHCDYCEFQSRCRARAKDTDDLSLLSAI